jgi:hypothetical protein
MSSSGIRGGRVRFNNLGEVYDLLSSKATLIETKELIEYGYPAVEGDQILMYQGHSTKDAKALGMLDSAISHALATLKAMNAITMLRIGAKNRPSIYLLHYKPTMEQFEQFMGRAYAIDRKVAPTNYDQLVNDLVRVRERLDEAERKIRELEEYRDRHDLRRG